MESLKECNNVENCQINSFLIEITGKVYIVSVNFEGQEENI